MANKESCFVNASNYKLGFAMYLSYFVLFCVLFKSLYIDNKSTQSFCTADKEVCGLDGAGRFFDANSGRRASSIDKGSFEKKSN